MFLQSGGYTHSVDGGVDLVWIASKVAATGVDQMELLPAAALRRQQQHSAAATNLFSIRQACLATTTAFGSSSNLVPYSAGLFGDSSSGGISNLFGGGLLLLWLEELN